MKKLILLLASMAVLFWGCKKDKLPAPVISIYLPCEVFVDRPFIIYNNTTGAENYSWDFGNGMSSALSNPPVYYHSAGVFTIKLNVRNKDNSITISRQITVREEPPTSAFVPVQYELQPTQSWCWAASIQMALSGFGINKDQCSMVNYYIFGSANGGVWNTTVGQYCNCCNYPSGHDTLGTNFGYSCINANYTPDITSEILRLGNKYSEKIEYPLSPDEIKMELSQGRPVINLYDPETTFSGHYAVIFGYDEHGFYMYDPFYPSQPLSPLLPQYWVGSNLEYVYYGGGNTPFHWISSIYKIGGEACK